MIETLRCFSQLIVAGLGAGIAFLIGNHVKPAPRVPPVLSIGNVHIPFPMEAEPDANALAVVLSMHTEDAMWPIIHDSDEWETIGAAIVAIVKWRKVALKTDEEAAKVLATLCQNIYCAGYFRAQQEKEIPE